MWEIRSAADKGLGVFAKALIRRGTRIFSERPLLAIRHDQDASDIYPAARLLSAEDRRTFLGLSSHITKESAILRWNHAFWHILKQNVLDTYLRLQGKGEFSISGLPSMRRHVAITSIFRSNAFDLGNAVAFQEAVFPRISRMNHSCIPNAQGNFHEPLGCFNIHAIRDIEVDEELTLNYLHEHISIRDSRQGRLLKGYGFVCECPACDLTSLRGSDGEESRIQMGKLLGDYAELVAQNADPEAELRTTELLLKMLEKEGVAGRELSTM
jgi:hypothetical protein